MPNIKLTIEYDGTHFFGFQRQRTGRTVQAELESALKKLFQKKITVIASGFAEGGPKKSLFQLAQDVEQ